MQTFRKRRAGLSATAGLSCIVSSFEQHAYADTAATGVGRVAHQAANMKSAKYADFTTSYIFQPTKVENLGLINSSALPFLNNLGQRICTVSGDDRQALFLFQRISYVMGSDGRLRMDVAASSSAGRHRSR